MRIGLLSDTHGFLDDTILGALESCDEIWHAGDFGTMDVLTRLETCKPVRAVYGNVDGATLRSALPEDLTWTCDGVKVYMTHIGGYPGAYDRRAGAEVRRLRPDLFICGHSHILKVMRDPATRMLHMNPGAAGHHGWHQVRTMLRFSIAAGKISDVEAIEFGPRGRSRRP
jgi:putative phosphoesterase